MVLDNYGSELKKQLKVIIYEESGIGTSKYRSSY